MSIFTIIILFFIISGIIAICDKRTPEEKAKQKRINDACARLMGREPCDY